MNDLTKNISGIGNRIGGILSRTVEVISRVDFEQARSIVTLNSEINVFCHNMETECLKVIGLQHPFASDLRTVTTCLKMTNDLERIGDQCVEVCEIINMRNIDDSNSIHLAKTVEMFELSVNMFERVLNSFKECDEFEARDVCSFDDKIDTMFSEMVSDISAMISRNPKKVRMGADLMFISKYAERIADHCTSIAEWIIYMVSGVHPTLN
jgi:phosphate transport system protein